MILRKIALIIICSSSLNLFAQNFSYKHERDIAVAKLASIRLTDIAEADFTLKKLVDIAPEPWTSARAVKAEIDRNRKRRFSNTLHKYEQSEEDLKPQVVKDFDGLPVGTSGIPNDNNIAISNDGVVISVINSSITVFDSNGTRLIYRTLANIVGAQLPSLNRTYDPKVVYDPDSDRFILVFLQGSTSNDTRIVVGFTATNDPLGVWNFYAINGNPFEENTWSDYPIIGISKNDLYVTVNILRDGESWQEGFTQSVIWQVNKQSGYDGNDSIYQDLFYDLKFDDKPLWSICAVPGGYTPAGPGMRFLSVRPGAFQNDSIFLHQITDDQQSGNAEYNLNVLKTSLPYGVPPSAFQPDPSNVLQTNDTRVLSAFEEGDMIQYVQSCRIPETNVSGIYHGVINLNDLTVSNSYITSDTLEYAYPSINHVGEQGGQASVITFSHVSELDPPGTSVVFHNRLNGQPGLYSPVVSVKNGETSINRLGNDSNERWGDYTGIQKRYNVQDEVWVCGSYGKEPGINSVWIGKIQTNTELNAILNVNEVKFLPNPAAMWSTVQFSAEKEGLVSFKLYSIEGKLVYEKNNQNVTSGLYEFSLNTANFRSGIYTLVVLDEANKEVISQLKIMVL